MSTGRDDELVPLAGDLVTRAELRRVMAREADEAEAAADAAERDPVTARPVGDGDGQDGLRVAVMRWLANQIGDRCWEPDPWEEWGDEADAVLALPEVAALRAKAAAADRVRKLADRFDASPYTHSNRTTADRIRRALDGPSC